MAAGVSGERPAAISFWAIVSTLCTPMRKTTVSMRLRACQIQAFVISDGVVAGHDRHRRRRLAVGHRNVGAQRRRQTRRDSWNDFKRHAVLGQIFHFFAATAEKEGIAALEPNDGLAFAGLLDQELVDFILPGAWQPRTLPMKIFSEDAFARARTFS